MSATATTTATAATTTTGLIESSRIMSSTCQTLDERSAPFTTTTMLVTFVKNIFLFEAEFEDKMVHAWREVNNFVTPENE